MNALRGSPSRYSLTQWTHDSLHLKHTTPLPPSPTGGEGVAPVFSQYGTSIDSSTENKLPVPLQLSGLISVVEEGVGVR